MSNILENILSQAKALNKCIVSIKSAKAKEEPFRVPLLIMAYPL